MRLEAVYGDYQAELEIKQGSAIYRFLGCWDLVFIVFLCVHMSLRLYFLLFPPFPLFVLGIALVPLVWWLNKIWSRYSNAGRSYSILFSHTKRVFTVFDEFFESSLEEYHLFYGVHSMLYPC
jgi:hypothetical protein